MPVFDYKCDKCGEVEEIYFVFFDEVIEKSKCSKCGSTSTKQFPSKGAFLLKNKSSDSSGWGDKGYSTKT